MAEHDMGKNIWNKFWSDESGATAIEYGLIAALVALAMVAGLSSLSGGTGGAWAGLSEDVTSAMSQ